ncbi:MAG: SAF domain-containing protein, partial [Planctomycetaceae bacterium]
RKAPCASEVDTAKAARKSLVAATDMPAGTRLTEELIAIRRPGTGLPPAMKPWLVSRTLRVDVAAGDLLRLEDVA